MKIDIGIVGVGDGGPSFDSDWKQIHANVSERFIRFGEVCIRVRVQGITFWILTTYGHTGDSTINYQRKALTAKVTVAELDVPCVLPWQESQSTTYTHEVVLDEGGGSLGHGQGVSLKIFAISPAGELYEPSGFADIGPLPVADNRLAPWFSKPTPPPWSFDYEEAVKTIAAFETKNYAPFQASRYVLAGTGQGGDRLSFGVHRCLPDIYGGGHRLGAWRKQLYQLAHRPGLFNNPDGSLPTDVGTKWVLDAGGWPHPNSTERPWFFNENVFVNQFARDPLTGVEWGFYGDQHISDLAVLCEVFLLYRDEGMAMLIDHIAESVMQSMPVVEKGTSHHFPGAARARGREAEALAHLFWAVRDPDRKKRLGERLQAVLQWQVDAWQNDLPDPWPRRSDGVSPWEHGLWVKGLACSLSVPYDQALKDQVIVIGLTIAGQVFEWFQQWENEHWEPPYVVDKEDGEWVAKSGPAIGEWCLPAMQLLYLLRDKFPQTPENLEKIQGILSEWVWNRHPMVPAPWDRPTPWDRRSEWLIF